ncbi:MAG: hypothetical protein WCS87_18765 [Methylococcaceae bacterium]
MSATIEVDPLEDDLVTPFVDEQGMYIESLKLGSITNPTWNPDVRDENDKRIGGWVDATPERDGGSPNDERMVKGRIINGVSQNNNLMRGELSDQALNEITPAQVAQINPISDVPREILKYTLNESWHHAKDNLIDKGDTASNKEARNLLMTKLWEFRKWHHDMILQQTQRDSRIGDKGLTKWASAGSNGLTSDIDVNLKGTKTELAVAVFNELFKKDGWKNEAGVVYDVNVYAMDFMHADTFNGLAERLGVIKSHKFKDDSTPMRVSAKEGARDSSQGGGVNSRSTMLEERMLTADANIQRIWSLVKMRLYMTAPQWRDYETNAGLDEEIKSGVTSRYDSYRSELKAKMKGGDESIVVADDAEKTGFQFLDSIAKAKSETVQGSDSENIKMEASNRIYEKKLIEMSILRSRVQYQIGMISSSYKVDVDELDSAIDGNLAILRDLISECAMYSNEAYVTDGAVNHAVVGLQSKIGITQTKSESMDAFNENVADSLKEIARHNGSLGEAAYKAGKYLWRMADAAKNMGSDNSDIEKLYKAAYIIANTIKGGPLTQVESENVSAGALTVAFPDKNFTPDTLMDFVRELAIRVAVERKEDLLTNGLKRGQVVNHEKH